MDKNFRIIIEDVDSFAPELMRDLIEDYLKQQTGLEYNVMVTLREASQPAVQIEKI